MNAAPAALNTSTHEVFNQPPPLADTNLFTTDRALAEALGREGAGWAEPQVTAFGAVVGSAEATSWGFQANENPPALRAHDRYGNRIDEVEFHPAYHHLMRTSLAHGLHNLNWANPRTGAHVARAALMFLASQNEQGHTCPVSMTWSAVPALRHAPELAAEWLPRILSAEYDPRCRAVRDKTGATIGMGMTEKQGGSDVRANTTTAEAIGGREYLITGHKWFCSAPMCDAFLILAQAPGGLTCFLLPRWTPDGERNRFHLQRLKNKLGNRSNASSEVEFQSAWATRIGEEGRGVASIIEMVRHTRLDCVIGSAALLRQGFAQALHHTRHRKAFGKLLIDQPLMQNVLADLALESEAATVLMMRLARAFEGEPAFARLATAIAKFWICKRAPMFLAEAVECLGGNGYVEESMLPRLYREAPLNSIWEGSGNVICLDILRALNKEPAAVEAVLAELRGARGADRRYDTFLSSLEPELQRATEAGARHLAERLALALEACLLLRYSPHDISDAFCGARLSADRGHVVGALAASPSFTASLRHD